MKMMKFEYQGVIYSKKNNKRIITNHRTGRPMITSNRKAKTMEEMMANQFMIQKIMNNKFIQIKPPFEVLITIWEKDHTRRDLDNQATSVLDGLVRAGVIEDDSVNYIERLEVKLGGYDKQRPRAEIIIKERG